MGILLRSLGLLSGLVMAISLSAPALAQPPFDFDDETHFRCYIVSQQTPGPAKTVTLSDQFMEPVTLTVDEPVMFCPPTDKNDEGIDVPKST